MSPRLGALSGRLWFGFLCLLVLLLQYTLWLGKNGMHDWRQQQLAIESQEAENDRLRARNDILLADVRHLKAGLAGIEERARKELGMVRKDEVFYQIVPPSPQVTGLKRFQFGSE